MKGFRLRIQLLLATPVNHKFRKIWLPNFQNHISKPILQPFNFFAVTPRQLWNLTRSSLLNRFWQGYGCDEPQPAKLVLGSGVLVFHAPQSSWSPITAFQPKDRFSALVICNHSFMRSDHYQQALIMWLGPQLYVVQTTSYVARPKWNHWVILKLRNPICSDMIAVYKPGAQKSEQEQQHYKKLTPEERR